MPAAREREREAFPQETQVAVALTGTCPMAQSGYQVPFRRILLSRLLLLSVPVLLLGVYVTSHVTYRKARSALLETARQNLTESAVRKRRGLEETIELIEANMAALSNSHWLTEELEAGKPLPLNALEQLQQRLPEQFACLQLRALETGALLAGTCPSPLPNSARSTPWPAVAPRPLLAPTEVDVQVLLPEPASAAEPGASAAAGDNPSGTLRERNFERYSRLDLVLSAPLYDTNGQLRYVLQARATLRDRSQVVPGSLAGYPAIVNQAGTILVHPLVDRIGRNIQDEADAQRLQSLLRNALAGENNFLHLFSFDDDGSELLAGYTAMPSPVSSEAGQQWAVLAIASLDGALADLEAIRRVLLGLLASLTLALIAASTAAIVYISRETARPLEKLRDYALNQDNLYSNVAIPHNFRIREFNQLGLAFEQMLGRLRAWTEELEQAWHDAKIANQLKDEFLTIASHELRTPLNGILGSLSIVQDELCDSREEERAYLAQAQQSALQLYKIVTEISDITKLQVGQLTVSLEAVDLADCLNAAVANYTGELAAKGLDLHWTEPSAPIWVYADRQQLQRVFGIVLDNAIKFTAAGSVTLAARVEASAAAANGQWAIATIRDTGIGVAPELQPKLFKPFAVVDGSHTRQYGGIGLGLAIARNLMELMQGSIRLDSNGCDCGTTVSIGLPVARQVDFAIASKQAGSASPA